MLKVIAPLEPTYGGSNLQPNYLEHFPDERRDMGSQAVGGEINLNENLHETKPKLVNESLKFMLMLELLATMGLLLGAYVITDVMDRIQQCFSVAENLDQRIIELLQQLEK